MVFRMGGRSLLDTTFIFPVLVRLWKGKVHGCLAILPAGLLPELSLSNNDPSAHTVPVPFWLSTPLHSLAGDCNSAVSVQSQKGGLWYQRPPSPPWGCSDFRLPAPPAGPYCSLLALGFPPTVLRYRLLSP